MDLTLFHTVNLALVFIPLLPAIILFIIGYLRVLKRRDWEKTEGITVEDPKFGLGYPKPIVKYEVEGITYEVQSTIGQRPHLPSGRQVGVYYNPENPREMMIDTFIQRGTFFFLVGGFFLLFSFFAFILYLTASSFINNIS